MPMQAASPAHCDRDSETAVPQPLQKIWLPFAAAAAAIAALLASCSTGVLPEKTPAPAPIPGPLPAPAPSAAAPAPPVVARPAPSGPAASSATSALAYRRDAARHLYNLNPERIYKGMLQPQLYAIGVLDVDIDRRGQITAINWRRAPHHVPEVMAEIVRTVRAAAPYPVPSRMGRVTYTDIWLWDKSGQFQLDTLTEGQL